MSSANTSNVRDWFFAALVGVLAVVLRALLQPWLGDRLPFVFAYPAVVLASVLWGIGPGLLIGLICASAVMKPDLPPDLPRETQSVEIGSFLLCCIVVALLSSRWRPNRLRLAASRPASAERPDTPLTSWLRAVLWGAFLIPLTAWVCAAWWGFEQARADAEATAEHACDLAYRQAQRTFGLAAEIAARADAAALNADDPANEEAVHQRLADMAAALPSVVNLNIWGADGGAVARSDAYPVERSASVADRAYFQELRKRPSNEWHTVHVSEVFEGRQTGREIINTSLRRSSPDGTFRGAVAVSLSPDWFRSYYQSLANEDPKVATFALIRTDGVILARVPPIPAGRARVSYGRAVLDRVIAGEMSGKVLLPGGASGQTRLVAFRRIEGYPLYVVAGFSRQAMYANWERFIGLLAAVLVPTTAVLVYVSWVALKKTRREQATFDELQEQIRLRANAEKSMIESQKLETLAVVTGGVAHDFNNLLAIVNASLHVLKRRHPDVAQEKQVVAMARAIQTGVRLTRQLLSFSRKQALRPETVHLQTWLPASEGLIQSTLGPDIAWESAVDPGTLPVQVDVGELELALINLVVNARHAMPGGGSLVVKAGNAADVGAALPSPLTPSSMPSPTSGATAGFRQAPGETMVCLSVRDTGVGIPSALLAKVLEPFFTTRDKGAGSGLGLSQVQGFCVQAGGFVRIESQVGTGTTVSMFLPAVAVAVAVEPPGALSGGGEPQVGEPDVSELPDLPPLHGLVLLVEDNEALATTTEMMLRSAGLGVVCARTADEALAHLDRARLQPDVVLSDIAMPGSMNGIALAFHLRRFRPDLPVLLTTGYAEQVNEATAAGLRVLPKPTPPEEMLAELRAALPATVH